MNTIMEKNEKLWKKMYQYAKAYSEEHGGLNISSSFTIEGENGEIITLGSWISRQKSYFLTHPDKQGNQHYVLLEKLGFDLKKRSLTQSGYEMLELARNFYNKNGHLNIFPEFKTFDGIKYSEDGKGLGIWILTKRRCYKKGTLSQECIDYLNSIGMIWDVHKNKIEIAILCHELGIDATKNKFILGQKSILEFKVKLAFIIKSLSLLQTDIDIVDDTGILHEIFFMFGDELKSSYGITLEKLIEEYGKVTSEDLIQLYGIFKYRRENQSCRVIK